MERGGVGDVYGEEFGAGTIAFVIARAAGGRGGEELLDCCCAGFGVEIENGNVAALGVEVNGCCEAEAGGAAGDDEGSLLDLHFFSSELGLKWNVEKRNVKMIE